MIAVVKHVLEWNYGATLGLKRLGGCFEIQWQEGPEVASAATKIRVGLGNSVSCGSKLGTLLNIFKWFTLRNKRRYHVH